MHHVPHPNDDDNNSDETSSSQNCDLSPQKGNHHLCQRSNGLATTMTVACVVALTAAFTWVPRSTGRRSIIYTYYNISYDDDERQRYSNNKKKKKKATKGKTTYL